MNDFFKDLKQLLNSKTIPNRPQIERILSAYQLGTITLTEALTEIAKWFEDADKF